MDSEKQEIVSAVARAVEDVGQYQLRFFRSESIGRGDRKSEKEFVSQVDIHSEHMLRKSLSSVIPESSFYGEETLREIGENYTWVVDPLDGTTNFLSGLDQWSVSVCLLHKRDPLLAVVYKPVTGELFSGVRGVGVQYKSLSGTSEILKKVADCPLSEALVGTGFPYRSPDTQTAFFSCAHEVLECSRGIRRMGSAALDLSYLSAGYLQAFWEVDLQAYDVAAAVLFLRETGCRITDFTGAPYSLFSSRTLVAGLPEAQEELQQITHRHYGDL
jgi:myo-inositol-1(or 4)-monophosphatase